MKCLSVATELYGQLRMGKLSPSLRTLVESLVSVAVSVCVW